MRNNTYGFASVVMVLLDDLLKYYLALLCYFNSGLSELTCTYKSIGSLTFSSQFHQKHPFNFIGNFELKIFDYECSRNEKNNFGKD